MSKVTVAESAGFCFGVDRAVKMVYGELEKNTKVATLGPIIHNQDVVSDMQSKGARTISSVDELAPDETVEYAPTVWEETFMSRSKPKAAVCWMPPAPSFQGYIK